MHMCAEIGILHTIAADAQEILDTAPERRRPKPIAALFKAYDEILPQHGIDPDEDRHLSAFLFKLGGEEGENSFVEKLQNILGRMGIMLEFEEDDTTEENKRSSSPVPSEAHSMRSARPHPIVHRSPMKQIGRPQTARPQTYFGSLPPAQGRASSTRPPSISHQSSLQPIGRPAAASPEPYFSHSTGPGAEQNEEFSDYTDDEHDDDELHDHEDMEELSADPETEQAAQLARRATLSAALNKWRDAAARSQRNQGALSLAASMNKMSIGLRKGQAAQAPASSHAPLRTSAQAQSTKQDQIPTSSFQQRTSSAQSAASFRPIEEPITSAESNQTLPAHSQSQTLAPKPSLLPIFDRWRAAASQRKEEDAAARQTLSPVAERTQETTTRMPVSVPWSQTEQKKHSLSPEQDRASQTARTTSLREALENRIAARKEHQNEPVSPEIRSAVIASPKNSPDGVSQSAQTPQDQAALRAREERDMQRAARAREIFLASRVFNHWADRTARRLEREAVARRHMIRFRCFKGWSQVTTSRAPAIERLRVVTAAQKLKRACLEHEEQLRVTAAAAAQSYRFNKMQTVLNRWQCHLAHDVAQKRLAHKTRLKTVTRWYARAEDDADIGFAVTNSRRKADGIHALIRWQGASELGALRDRTAAQWRGERVKWKVLREWWDQAEAHRRSKQYREYSLAQKASHAFDIWNLQARAQAFVWHTQYRTVSRIFDYWLARSKEDAYRQFEASRMYAHAAKAKFVDQIYEQQQQQEVLKRQADRSVLYIRSHCLLDTLNHALERREERARQQVRQYLMRRYEEVSRARKKRNFFHALDCWRALTAQAQQMAVETQETHRAYEERRVLSTIDMWSVKTAEAQEVNRSAHEGVWRGKFYRALDNWTESAADHEHNQMAAAQHNADRKKRQVQKLWSNSTLQHGSHAHTAAALRQRYDRGKRNKAFNVLLRWQAKDTSPGVDTELASRTRRLTLTNSSRTRDRSQENTSRRLLFGASQGTPSRPPTAKYTPTPRRSRVDFSSSNLASTKRPTPIREEVGEGSRILDDEEVVAKVKSPASSPRGLGNLLAHPRLPSTTPKGPIPSHVEGGLPPRKLLGGASHSLGNQFKFPQQSQGTATPSTNVTLGSGTAFSSRSTSNIPDRSISNSSGASLSVRPYSRTTGTGATKAVETQRYQSPRPPRRPVFGSSTATGGKYRPQLPERLFPSPERQQDDDHDIWDDMEEPEWGHEVSQQQDNPDALV